MMVHFLQSTLFSGFLKIIVYYSWYFFIYLTSLSILTFFSLGESFSLEPVAENLFYHQFTISAFSSTGFLIFFEKTYLKRFLLEPITAERFLFPASLGCITGLFLAWIHQFPSFPGIQTRWLSQDLLAFFFFIPLAYAAIISEEFFFKSFLKKTSFNPFLQILGPVFLKNIQFYPSWTQNFYLVLLYTTLFLIQKRGSHWIYGAHFLFALWCSFFFLKLPTFYHPFLGPFSLNSPLESWVPLPFFVFAWIRLFWLQTR